MPKAATDVMQAIIFSAVADAFDALKAASKGVPNTMLRDIQAVHRNATFADLPKELQDAINASVPAAAMTAGVRAGHAGGRVTRQGRGLVLVAVLVADPVAARGATNRAVELTGVCG